ncbi:MAG: cytochrome C [Deltaproteobacteria bacterium]|nr:MAG: cytochrome C [Deltaproteobacteria bacterium]RLC22351.1 MAG: cytochrome C [Deltaproteobacteria bacterium]
MRNRIVIFCLMGLFLSTAMVFAQGKGAKQINLHGGKQGDITFPHHMHHTVVNDCMVCHKDFPQEPGALQASKDSGALKKKQMMNKTCLKCHRDRKKAGKPYGPVRCSGCHIR